jgi:surface antigen
MHAIPAVLVFVAFACFGVGSCLAVQGEFLRDMPIESMNEEDIGLLMDTLNHALEKEPDRTTTRWENPKTRAQGLITPLNTFEKSGKRCRQAEISNSVRGRSNRLVAAFCRQNDGTWKVEPQ